MQDKVLARCRLLSVAHRPLPRHARRHLLLLLLARGAMLVLALLLVMLLLHAKACNDWCNLQHRFPLGARSDRRNWSVGGAQSGLLPLRGSTLEASCVGGCGRGICDRDRLPQLRLP